MTKIFNRLFRASLFQRDAFREAYFDNDASADGAITVSLVAAATYLGLLAASALTFSVTGLLAWVIGGVTSWLILAFATWGVARYFFNSMARPQIMVGVQGLAVLPLVLDVFDNQVIGALGLVWYIALLVMGTREVTDLDIKKSGVSVLIGFAAAVLVRALLNVPFAAFSSIF
ncbi:MAG TPA: hypothetical protein VIW94_07480 [Acidimicrobiia bacterium]